MIPEPHWWSWADVVSHADRLGIPNFQRGAVWDNSNVLALLESIYERSPCGTLVLWAPEDEREPFRHGVALQVFAPDKDPMWLVDGQQRTRALFGIFRQLVESHSDTEDWSLVRHEDIEQLRRFIPSSCLPSGDPDDQDLNDTGENPGLWVSMLPAMPVLDSGPEPFFGRHSESRNIRRSSFFRFVHPRARLRLGSSGSLKVALPVPVGMIPMAALLSPSSIFGQGTQLELARRALSTFPGENPELETLGKLIPWGPQFVTGYAFEHPGIDDRPATPLRWSDIHALRDETNVSQMVGRLAALFSPRWAPLFERYRGMLEGDRFAVGWLPRSDVSAAIDAYVRINRSGIRVRPEERALALLSRARPSLLDDLATFIEGRDGGDVENQRDLLAHESDRHMGFSVWITVVTRFTALALMGDNARRWTGVSAIDRKDFAYRLDRVGPNETVKGRSTWARPGFEQPGELIEDCAKRATAALIILDQVLSEELFLDHRMARQHPRSLVALIDLLYRIPTKELNQLGSDDSFRAALGRLVHWTLLVPYIDQADLEQLVVDTHGIDDTEAARNPGPISPWAEDTDTIRACLVDAFGRYQQSLLTVSHRKISGIAEGRGETLAPIEKLTVHDALNHIALANFSFEVKESRSLQHTAVGWLYAIERRGSAQEFSWRAQVEGFEKTHGKCGIPPSNAPSIEARLCWNKSLDEDLYPEKQHIVPFALARQIVDKGGTRATASPANAIGNLTWLSRRQNKLEALADRWTVMDRDRDYKNLHSRGMFAKTVFGGKNVEVHDVYQRLQDLVINTDFLADKSEAQELFAAFSSGRADWIVIEMEQWLKQPVSEAVAAWLTFEPSLHRWI